MEFFLQNIANYYISVSCLLIVWGVFAVHALYEVITHSVSLRHTVRRLDVWYMCALSVCTSVLFCCLVAFLNDVATQFILHLFIFELWYALFAVFFTMNYLRVCLIFTASSNILNQINDNAQPTQ